MEGIPLHLQWSIHSLSQCLLDEYCLHCVQGWEGSLRQKGDTEPVLPLYIPDAGALQEAGFEGQVSTPAT